MKGTPPLNSGLATVGAGESPNVERTPLYSGTSVTSESPPLTPPVKSCCSTVGADSSPEVDNTPVYSGISSIGDSVKGTPPLNSGLATVGAAKSPDVPKIPESSFPLSFFGSNFPSKSLSESFLEGSTS